MATIFYSMSRGTGKIEMLVKESAKTEATIVVHTRAMANCIERKANELNLVIPAPISTSEYIARLKHYGLYSDQKYLIDDLQIVLEAMNIQAATIDRHYVKDDFTVFLFESKGAELYSDVKIATETEPTF